jgi:hypothetical protein
LFLVFVVAHHHVWQATTFAANLNGLQASEPKEQSKTIRGRVCELHVRQKHKKAWSFLPAKKNCYH